MCLSDPKASQFSCKFRGGEYSVDLASLEMLLPADKAIESNHSLIDARIKLRGKMMRVMSLFGDLDEKEIRKDFVVSAEKFLVGARSQITMGNAVVRTGLVDAAKRRRVPKHAQSTALSASD